jgi:hypothetical protein
MVRWAVCLFVDVFDANKLKVDCLNSTPECPPPLLILQQNNAWDDVATYKPQPQWLNY